MDVTFFFLKKKKTARDGTHVPMKKTARDGTHVPMTEKPAISKWHRGIDEAGICGTVFHLGTTRREETAIEGTQEPKKEEQGIWKELRGLRGDTEYVENMDWQRRNKSG